MNALFIKTWFFFFASELDVFFAISWIVNIWYVVEIYTSFQYKLNNPERISTDLFEINSIGFKRITM